MANHGPILRHRFVVPGDPVGKPRMTQRDVWARRPAVLRYRAYCDRIRLNAGKVPADPLGLLVTAYIAMPDSWSERRKTAMEGAIHRQKPDYDNIAKAVGDALFTDDSVLGTGTCTKFWTRAGDARTDITVLFMKYA